MEGKYIDNMEKAFKQDDRTSIVQAEEKTYALYIPVFDAYASLFKEYGASLVTGIEREFQPLYRAYIICKVTDCAGKVIESNDRDMFMDFAWILSSADGGIVNVSVDVDDDLVPLLQSCQEYFRHPY